MVDLTIKEFLGKLSTAEPVPGGGGASALAGGICAALCSMVASLTTGKKKYAQYQQDIERILAETDRSVQAMEALIQKDAEAFAPLSKAYGIPKETPGRDAVLEDALKTACSAPLEILQEACKIVPVLEELVTKGSKIALSDVGVAAAACETAVKGSLLNIAINTRLMKDRAYADRLDREAAALCRENLPKCDLIYTEVLEQLTGGGK